MAGASELEPGAPVGPWGTGWLEGRGSGLGPPPPGSSWLLWTLRVASGLQPRITAPSLLLSQLRAVVERAHQGLEVQWPSDSQPWLHAGAARAAQGEAPVPGLACKG